MILALTRELARRERAHRWRTRGLTILLLILSYYSCGEFLAGIAAEQDRLSSQAQTHEPTNSGQERRNENYSPKPENVFGTSY